jgi:hypothetical protein
VSRWKTTIIHLAISLALAATIGIILFYLWFPPPYFIAADSRKLPLVLMGMAICIGPLLTLLVASPRKSQDLLRLDISIIAALQVLAFGYGIYATAITRPVFVVAEADRFILVSANEISDADLAQGKRPDFRSRSWTGPRLVGAIPPGGDEGGRLALSVMEGGKDIDQLPRYYMPYGRVATKFARHAKALDQLTKATAEQHRQLERLQVAVGAAPLQTLPLQRGDKDFTAILSPRTKKPIRILALDSW